MAMTTHPAKPRAAVIGGGPAGLMAAECLARGGMAVTVFERMPSVARKFLMAGRGGLNLTHSENLEMFLSRYGAAEDWLTPAIRAFSPDALRGWAEGLGVPLFVGSSGRVFPKAMKASPLLRAWLKRLGDLGVELRLGVDWQGWDGDGALRLSGGEAVRADVTVLALGGASWPRLGSDGGWAELLRARGVAVTPFRAANAGFDVAWSDVFAQRFAGEPLKGVALRFGDRVQRGEAMVTRYGLEGGAVYALSADLREGIARDGTAAMTIDLRPEVSLAALTARLEKAGAGQSVSNVLRKAAGLSPVAANLMREAGVLPRDAGALAASIKAVPVTLTGMQGLLRAISSAGGIARAELDDGFQLRRLPGVYAVGEMLVWEAPTGGYLLQACFATAHAAASAALKALGAAPGKA
ncbi:MAG: TIGR03862 family flavoprotein [Micropepsaceae bacterium]